MNPLKRINDIKILWYILLLGFVDLFLVKSLNADAIKFPLSSTSLHSSSFIVIVVSSSSISNLKAYPLSLQEISKRDIINIKKYFTIIPLL